MKKRRSLVIAALLVAALALGIGYAGLSQEVKITGDIASSAVTFDVVFTESNMVVTTRSDSTTRVADITALSSAGTTGSGMIHLKAAGLKEAGDTVTYTLTIQNKSDVVVDLTKLELIDSDTQEAIDLTDTDALDDHFAPFTFAVTGCEADQELAPNAITTVTITVSLSETSETAASHSYSLKATAAPKNNSSND